MLRKDGFHNDDPYFLFEYNYHFWALFKITGSWQLYNQTMEVKIIIHDPKKDQKKQSRGKKKENKDSFFPLSIALNPHPFLPLALFFSLSHTQGKWSGYFNLLSILVLKRAKYSLLMAVDEVKTPQNWYGPLGHKLSPLLKLKAYEKRCSGRLNKQVNMESL